MTLAQALDEYRRYQVRRCRVDATAEQLDDLVETLLRGDCPFSACWPGASELVTVWQATRRADLVA